MAVAPLRSVAFVLPLALPSLNERQRSHWRELGRQQQRLSQEVMAALGGPHWFPRPPFAKARVTVVRHSAGSLDPDSLYGCNKPLLDVLCRPSKIHPCGLGIIEDDAPSKCELVVSQQKSSRGDQFTAVRVEELA